ncbi:MAG TPA: dihydrolipoamide acetyltransferase family protein [Ktedonobacterales bacterium]
MPTKITMPQLGESVAEGTVGRWLKNVGDMVKRDESLVEIITDKVTAELPSPVSGRLTQIYVKEDETVKVGTEIAEIDDGSGASTTASGPGVASTTSAPTPSTAPNGNGSAPSTASAPAPSTPVAASTMSATGNVPSAMSNGIHATATHTTAVQEKVSPLARRLAQEHQIDLSQVQGTGEGGRVRKEDILAYVAQRNAQPSYAAAAPSVARGSQPPTAPSVPTFARDEVITPSPARRVIAEHMVRSKHTAPHATTLVEVDMTNLGRWLDRHKDEFKQREGYGISYQTFVIKATVEALKEHPYLNASWTEDNKILLRKQINVGVSIALNDNLIVPVIRNADTLNLAGIAQAVNDLVTRARTNRLLPADLQGSTFTVNNPGVFGTLISMAIINQPNAGILTMDAIVKRPVVIDDAIAIRSMMYMSLSFDHRVIDGMTAAQFLGAIKRRLEAWGADTIDVY